MYVKEAIFCGHSILTEVAFLTQMSSGNLSLKNAVGYDKLLFHE